MLLKTNPETEKIIKDEITGEELKILIKFGQSLELKKIQKLMEGFLRVKEEMKHSPIPTLPLEIIVLENSSKG